MSDRHFERAINPVHPVRLRHVYPVQVVRLVQTVLLKKPSECELMDKWMDNELIRSTIR